MTATTTDLGIWFNGNICIWGDLLRLFGIAQVINPKTA